MNSMKKLTPLKAIRQKCLDCSCWQTKEVKLCPIIRCTLYPYRFGKRPRMRRGNGPEMAAFEKNHKLAHGF
jgi:hypothetical protein